MEMITFDLDVHQSKSFYAAIRCRFNVLEVWMQAIKSIINYYPPANNDVFAKISVCGGSINRLFYSGDDKVYSLAFPFKVFYEEGSYSVKTISGIDMDSRLSSEILLIAGVLKSQGLRSEYDIIQYLEDQGGASEFFWQVLCELLDAEDGYLRFDHDPGREKGHKHPLNHADLFYTNGATFKIGLHKRLDISEIIDILNSETDCHYLGQFRDRR